MAKKYKKDIKVVLPHIDPFRDIAVYGAGEEMIKAMGGVVHSGIKKPAIVPTSNNPYFKKYGDGGIGKPTFGRSETYAEFAKNEAIRNEITDAAQIKQNKSNKFSYKQKDKVKNPEYKIQLPELTIRPEQLNTKPNFITSPSGKTPIQPLNVPGRYSAEQNAIDIQKRKEKEANMPLHPLAQGVVDVAGLAYYPAAILGSGIDVYKGNYGAAAAGLVPFGNSLRTIKALMNTAKTVGVNANKIAKTTKVLNTGVAGANTYDLYDDFVKDKLEEKAYGGFIKKYGDGGKKQTVIHTDKALFDKAYKAEMDSMRLYNLSGKLASGNYVYPENYQFPDNPKYIEDYKVKYSPTGLDDGQKIGGSSTKQREIVEKSLKEKIKPLGYTYRDFAVPVYQKPRVKNILQERKPNLESIATRPMDLSGMNVGEDYSMLTPKSNKKESKLKRLSPYTSSTSQYKGEIVDFEGRKELTKQEYEEAVKKYGEGYFKAYGGPLNNTDTMKKSNKKGQNPRSILSPEQRMAMQFGWGGALGTVLGTGAALGLTALTGGAAAPLIPAIAGAGASIGGSIGSNIEQGIDKNKQARQPQFQPQQYQQALPQQMSFAKGGMLNKRGIPHKGTSEQMPYQTQMQSYPNLEFGNGEQMLAMGGELEDTEFAEGGIHIKPSKRGTFTAAATKHGKSVQGFASQVLANKENYSPAMVKKANFARNASKWKHAEGGFLNEPAEGVIERRNKNRSREPQEYATFEENFKHMYAQGGRMGAMGPMDMSKIYYADGGEEKEGPYKRKEVESTFEGPRNTFDIESTYVNAVDPNILAKQKEIATKLALSRIMGTQGNTTLGLTGNVNYSNAQKPMGEEESNTMLRKNPNVTGNIGVTGSYNKGNTSLTGGLGYDPISKTTTGNVGFKKQWADGGMLNHYNGYKHEDGGIPIGPRSEVEDGETSMKMAEGGPKDSTYIFSDQLKVPGKNYTFADSSKKIDSKYARRTNDKLSDESKKRELNKLMGTQEQERAGLVNSAYETIAAYGGPIRKYVLGGGTDPIGKTSSYFDFNEVNPAAGDMMTKDSYFDFNDPNNQADSEYDFNKMPEGYKTDFRKRQILGLPFVKDTEYAKNIENRINADINPEPEPKKLNSRQQKRLNQKMKFNPNDYLDNNIPNINRDLSPAEIDELMAEESMAEQPIAPMSPMSLNASPTASNKYNIPVKGITSQGSSIIPDQGGARSTVNPDGSITSDSGFGTGEQWAKGIGYGIQGAGLLARQLQLSSKKNKLRPNKAFTMERQLLNADPQLREADISAAIANRNIRDLGASTSSGGAMAGYLAAQAGRTRSKADIMADLQNRQAQIDMTTGQYNTMAGERAYDKDAADLAAQQTSQAQLFADMSKLGSGVTRDYLLGQSQEGLMESAYNPYFKYKKQKGRNKYNTEYTG